MGICVSAAAHRDSHKAPKVGWNDKVEVTVTGCQARGLFFCRELAVFKHLNTSKATPRWRLPSPLPTNLVSTPPSAVTSNPPYHAAPLQVIYGLGHALLSLPPLHHDQLSWLKIRRTC